MGLDKLCRDFGHDPASVIDGSMNQIRCGFSAQRVGLAVFGDPTSRAGSVQ